MMGNITDISNFCGPENTQLASSSHKLAASHSWEAFGVHLVKVFWTQTGFPIAFSQIFTLWIAVEKNQKQK